MLPYSQFFDGALGSCCRYLGPSLRGRSSGPAERSVAVPARVARRASAPLLSCCFPFATTMYLVAYLRHTGARALSPSLPPFSRHVSHSYSVPILDSRFTSYTQLLIFMRIFAAE